MICPVLRVTGDTRRPPRDHRRVLCQEPGDEGGGRGIQYRVAGGGRRARAGGAVAGTREALERLGAFRGELYRCLTKRADALFELADAMLCADGPVRTLAGISLAPEHRARARRAVRRGECGADRDRAAAAGGSRCRRRVRTRRPARGAPGARCRRCPDAAVAGLGLQAGAQPPSDPTLGQVPEPWLGDAAELQVAHWESMPRRRRCQLLNGARDSYGFGPSAALVVQMGSAGEAAWSAAAPCR